MWPFKKPIQPTPILPTRHSLFSTDVPVPERPDPFFWEKVFKKSFQKSPRDLRPTDKTGQNVAAMDAKPELDKSAIGSYAMDAPTEGNPLSMAPLISPIDNLPYMQLAWYAAQGFVGYQVCAMLSQHWLIDKAIGMPARDAARHGWELGTSDEDKVDPKIIAFIKKRDKQLRIKEDRKSVV